MSVVQLDTAHSAAGSGPAVSMSGTIFTHQIFLSHSTAAQAVIVHEGTNDNDPGNGIGGWEPIVTFTVSLPSSGEISEETPALVHSWGKVRSRCVSITSGSIARSTISGG